MPFLPIIHTWTEWGRMFTDVAHWEKAVREICRRESLPVRGIVAGYPGTNAVFIVAATYVAATHVVKVFAPFCHDDFDLECELHALLAQNPRLPVPHLIAAGVLDDRMQWPYIVLDFVPGEPIREARDRMSRDDLARVAAQLGDIVLELHRVPVTRLAAVASSRATWRQFVEQRRTVACDPARWTGILPETIVAEIPDFLTAILSVDKAAPLVLLNSDLTEDHVLLQQRDDGWHISGLIDFGDALVGRREYEWVALWFGALHRDRDCLAAFMARYDPNIRLDGDFFRVALAFTCVHEFGHLIVADALAALGNPDVVSLRDLQFLLW